MSAESYRAAARRYREVLGLLGARPPGLCGVCGHPDPRHRVADAIAGQLAAGDDVADVVADHLTVAAPGTRVEELEAAVAAYAVAVAALAAAPRAHGLSAGRAAAIDREVWAQA